MPEYTKRGRVLLQDTGSNDGTWGEEDTVGTSTRQDEMWGTAEVVVNAPVTLSANEGLIDEARSVTIICTGAGGFAVSAPSGVDKLYVVDNRCAAAITFQPSGGTGVSIPAGATCLIVSNAAGNVFVGAGMASSRTGAVFDLFGARTDNATAATTPNGLTTKAQVEGILFGTVGLPPPTGNAGKLLGTADGVNYSFLDAYPTIVGQNGKVLGVEAGAVTWTARNGLVKLSEQTISGSVAAVDIVSGIDTTYDEYEIHLYNIKPAVDSVLAIRTSSNGGSSFDAGASNYSSATGVDAAISATYYQLTSGAVGSDTNENGLSGVVRIFRPGVAHYAHISSIVTTVNGSGAAVIVHAGGFRLSTTAINAIRILGLSGNLVSGSLRVYGVGK